MAQLRKFEFHEGTMDNPIVLSQDYVDALISLWADENVEKSISGVVYKETLYDSEKDALEAIGLTVLTGAQLEDQFTVYPALEYLNEGESTPIEANGINAAALKFDVMEVKVTYDGDNLGEEYIASKIKFDFNVLKVDAAKENSSWIAEVTFKAYPPAHPINYRTGKVTINAVGITNVTISGGSMLNEGDTATYSGQVLPENNTKTFSKIAFSAKYGHFGDNLYSAPIGYASDIITATVSAYGKAYTGTKSLVIGTVILNSTDKNPVVFNAVKAGLRAAGWTTLGSQPIGSATEMTSVDAYNVTNSHFNSIIQELRKISPFYDFEEGQYFINVDSITYSTNGCIFGNVKNIILSGLTSVIADAYLGYLFGNTIESVNLPLLNSIYIGRGYVFQGADVSKVNMPSLTTHYQSTQFAVGNACIFNNCRGSVKLPRLQTAGEILIGCSIKYINLPSLTSCKTIALNCNELENIIAPKLTTINNYLANNCLKLRSIYIPKLITVIGTFSGNSVYKAFVGDNDYDYDESWDGDNGILDWSKSEITTINLQANAFNGVNSLYKWILPSSFITGPANYIYNNSKICIIDLRKCKNIVDLKYLLKDDRDITDAFFNLKFVRLASANPPSIADMFTEFPIFVPTAKFNNYKNDTSFNRIFFNTINDHNKIRLFKKGFSATLDVNVPITIGYKIELITQNDGAFTCSSNDNRFSLSYQPAYPSGPRLTVNGAMSSISGVNTLNWGSATIDFNEQDTTCVIERLGTMKGGIVPNGTYIKTIGFCEGFERFTIYNNYGEEVVNIVPALNEFDQLCLYDKVSKTTYLINKTTNIGVSGDMIEQIEIDTSNRTGAYDTIRAAYDQYLVDGTTECPWIRGESVNRLFPDEMMDWMCRSIFGFPKTWSGDLEDIPVDLLK